MPKVVSMLPVADTPSSSPEKAKERPTLVFGHSFGISRREWIEVSALLANEYRTIAIDTPGFGEARDITGYSVTEMVEHYAQTIQSLNLKRYVLVGHSMTGKVASILASKPEQYGAPAPERLVLLTPTPLGLEPLPEEARKELLEAHRDRAYAEKFITSHSHLPIPPAAKERAIKDVLRVHQDAWIAWLAKGTMEDWISRAAPIKTETLVIAAESDPEWGPEMQQRMTMPYLEHGKLVTVKRSGHLVPMEAPEELVDLLRAFATA